MQRDLKLTGIIGTNSAYALLGGGLEIIIKEVYDNPLNSLTQTKNSSYSD